MTDPFEVLSQACPHFRGRLSGQELPNQGAGLRYPAGAGEDLDLDSSDGSQLRSLGRPESLPREPLSLPARLLARIKIAFCRSRGHGFLRCDARLFSRQHGDEMIDSLHD